jgi:16S rRNA (guanine966-N2)-methyltransferase
MGLQVLQADATGVPWHDSVPPDLVFIDPPYDRIVPVAPRLFSRLAAVLQTHADPLVVMEMPGELELTLDGWRCVKRLGKGARQPTISFFKPVRGGLTAG